jgi:septal ring factor EnvC (AmiA/AmiB activator)
MKYSDPIIINSTQQKTSRRKKTGSKLGFIYVLLFILIWVGLVYGGFYFTKQYLDNAINNIQQTNAMNIQEVKERLDSLTNEMIALKSELSSTDETLSSSSSIQEQLNKKIDLLDSQLKNLEKSLKILKEAP